MTRNQKKRYIKKLIAQKLMGLAILAICVLIYFMVSGPNVPIQDDATPIVLFAPMGIYLLVTKKIVIY